MGPRTLRFLGGTEFGVVSTLLFAVLYTWPFLTFEKPGSTFRFIFVVWMAHIGVIASMSWAANKAREAEAAADADPAKDPVEQ